MERRNFQDKIVFVLIAKYRELLMQYEHLKAAVVVKLVDTLS